MIPEAIDTVRTLGWALLTWIVLLAAAATAALYTLTVAVTVPCTTAYKAVAGALAASRALNALRDHPGRYRTPQRPAWACTDDIEEAA